MPINVNWKSMLQSIRTQYCKSGKSVERDLSDGSKFGMCSKGWSVFFATMRSKGWKETEPPHKISETVFLEACEETLESFRKWYTDQKVKK